MCVMDVVEQRKSHLQARMSGFYLVVRSQR